MTTLIDIMDVGQGNMVLLQLDDGQIYLYDCNVTDDNEERVLSFLEGKIGDGTPIDVFINSHRDADHMRGVKRVHERFPIQYIWDSGVTGTSPDCDEYGEYMDLRLEVGCKVVKPRTRFDRGKTRLRIMTAKNDELADDANAQSIVIKVVERDVDNDVELESLMLTGDTDAATWQNIREHCDDAQLSCSLLMASHHGSLTFFDDPNDDDDYSKHIRAMKPQRTIISVGDNGYGHPDEKAVELYEKYTLAAKDRTKLYRTDEHGHVSIELKTGGGWSLDWATRKAAA